MMRRTTVEIDDEVLTRAKKALGVEQTKEAVDAALRRVADDEQERFQELRRKQLAIFRFIQEHSDLEVLRDRDTMWE